MNLDDLLKKIKKGINFLIEEKSSNISLVKLKEYL